MGQMFQFFLFTLVRRGVREISSGPLQRNEDGCAQMSPRLNLIFRKPVLPLKVSLVSNKAVPFFDFNLSIPSVPDMLNSRDGGRDSVECGEVQAGRGGASNLFQPPAHTRPSPRPI